MQVCLSEKYMSSRKTALVTGSAARIGAEVSRTLHRRGCDVLIHYNSSDSAALELADELNAERADSAFPAQADLSSPKGLEQLARETRKHFDRLDILVNNASRFYPTVMGQTKAWQWDDLLNSNLRGPYFLVQELLRETNTIGSKANDAEIGKHVVHVKSCIERIREMVQNVE